MVHFLGIFFYVQGRRLWKILSHEKWILLNTYIFLYKPWTILRGIMGETLFSINKTKSENA